MTFTPSTLGLPQRYSSYRPRQFETALDLAANAAQCRWSLLRASTGSGKTLLGATTIKLHGGRGLMLTGTRALQSQSMRDLAECGMKLVQGAANYRCLDGQRSTCDRSEHADNVRYCPYRRPIDIDHPVQCTQLVAYDEARRASLVTGNYAVWMAMSRLPAEVLGRFDLLWCDECHSILSWLTDACGVEFTSHELHAVNVAPPPVNESSDAWHEWACIAVEVVADVYRRSRDKGATQLQLAKLTDLGKRLRRVSEIDTTTEQWVGERTQHGARYVPVWPAPYAEAKLWRGVQRIVLSSATLTREDAKHLGIAGDAYTLHEVDAGFDAARCPLYYLPTCKVDMKMTEGEWRLVCNEFDRFMASRLALGRRGVVQATSYEWAKRVIATSRHAGQMVTHRRDSTEMRNTVARWARGEGPPVLVSPAVHEGHDFADNVARFQVIVKVPYPNSSSPIMRARCASDKSYRDHVTCRTMEQQCGRARRSHSDWAELFIADSHFGYMRARPMWSKSFRATWREVESVPAPMEVAA